MHILDIFETQSSTFSFEFFPPRSEEAANTLFQTLRSLERLKPSFVSVTYGAGGASRQLTHDLVVRIQQTTPLVAVPHLTCVGHREAEIQEILERYASAGVSNVLALGGDPPRDQPGYDRASDAFRHASDLVRFIARFNAQRIHSDVRGFGVGVAAFPEGHPSTPNRLREMDHLKAKVDAGANYICTQLFFDNRDFHDFRERCEIAGIRAPIIAGIMPITTLSGMQRMAELAAGARFPAALLRQVQRHANDAAEIEKIGVAWATEQCRELLEARVRGIHFYTLNRSKATLQIYAQLSPLLAPAP
ncbi:MAG: methylenetetrahydrofolate reductase [NAD(P)H] [Deltaproteobacteria bacterium]